MLCEGFPNEHRVPGQQCDQITIIIFLFRTSLPHTSPQVLAWALTGCGKYEQALKIYKDLLDAEQPQPDDLLNAAYCYWFDKQVVEAVKLFRRYGKQDGIQFNAAAEFAHEAENIRAHGISQIEVQLMVDLLL